MKLYLAHPLEFRHEIRKMELDIEEATGIELLNPFYDTGRDDIYAIDRGEKDRLSEDLDFDTIVKKDLKNLYSCDGLVAYIQKGIYSIGTLFEIWDAFKRGYTVYIVSPDSLMHPWIRYIRKYGGGRGFENWIEFKEWCLEQRR